MPAYGNSIIAINFLKSSRWSKNAKNAFQGHLRRFTVDSALFPSKIITNNSL